MKQFFIDLASLLLLAVLIGGAYGQDQDEKTPPGAAGDAHGREIRSLREKLDATHREIEELRLRMTSPGAEQAQKLKDLEERVGELEDSLDDLEDETLSTVDQAFKDLSDNINKVSRIAGANAFNPRLTVFGNWLGRFDSKTVRNEDGDAIDDRFFLREAEVDFRGDIGPFADTVMILSVEEETPGTFSTLIEEGYINLKKLPLLDDTFLQSRWKIGRFHTEAGQFNRLHTHDLPFVTRPAASVNFLGTDSFIADGVSWDFRIPSFPEDSTLDLTAQLLDGGGAPIVADNRSEDLAFLGHARWSRRFGESSDVTLGGTYYAGKNDVEGKRGTQLLGADFMVQWKPKEAGQTTSAALGGEVYYAGIERGREVSPGTTVSAPSDTPFGYFVWGQYQAGWHTYFTGRFDYFEALDDDALETRVYSVWASYYTSEFLRFRLGWEFRTSDIDEQDRLGTTFFEVNWVLGSHPVEPFWVSR